ncbi:hypothetical protein Pla22_24140 [Rubripirellula amarantea]|uniref:Uncharacterized protein n=1 Tax=Rubripirellula amarantea TaxID=2527999 RepID=A0A5C5WXC4_9BACT|nr:hypothetical protein Pla22_24140 [Rubripirellula amarantea]
MHSQVDAVFRKVIVKSVLSHANSWVRWIKLSLVQAIKSITLLIQLFDGLRERANGVWKA